MGPYHHKPKETEEARVDNGASRAKIGQAVITKALVPNAEVHSHEVFVDHECVDNSDDQLALGVLDAEFFIETCFDYTVVQVKGLVLGALIFL